MTAKMNMGLFTLLILLPMFSSCGGKSTVISKIQSHVLWLDGSNIVKVSKDSNDNYYISIVDTSYNYLEAANGCGNCYINFDSSILLKRKLSSDSKYTDYTLVAVVNGSTYGAEYLFILWNDSAEWNITRAPFHRFEFKDLDFDGREEIVEYPSGQDDSILYHFDKGQFIAFSKSKIR